MLRSYLKIALRNFWKNKVFSTVNIVGLALGIAAFGLILEYISFERSVNTFHDKLPSLYRLTGQNEDGNVYTDMAPAIAPLAKQTFPDVRAYCRIAEHSANGIITAETTKEAPQAFREDKLVYADASFFTLFTFPLVQGRAATALLQPNTVALSATKAQTYYGTDKAVGRSLTLNNRFGKTLYTVAAVYADMPPNSDFQFDAVFSLQTLANPANLNGNDWARLDGFDGNYLTTFLQLTEPKGPGTADYQALEAKFNAYKKQATPDDKSILLLQPATTLHLAASLSTPYRTTGSLGFIYLLGGIAGLILVIAWFNYVNLSTAGALKRAKEVGVRKVVGAGASQLIGQFLGESILLNGVGVGLAVVLIGALQPFYNDFVQRDLSVGMLASGGFGLAGLGLLTVGTLASGGYVAFALASYQPLQTLKGSQQAGGGWLRQTLVVAQFSASVALMVGTIVLYRQLQYMQHTDLGVQLAQRVVIQRPSVGEETALKPRMNVLEQQLSQLPYVKSLCLTGSAPGNPHDFSTTGIAKQNPLPQADKKGYSMGVIDNRFLTTYGIQLVAGRNFTQQEAELAWEKSAKLLVNETAVGQLGFASAAQAVGQSINWGTTGYEIVGVVKDYHHQGFRQLIDPVIFLPRRSVGDLTIQLTTDDLPRKLTELERLYKGAYPGNPFAYYFVDDHYNQQYLSEQQYGQVFTMASVLAILIACLGLFGLATFTSEQRTKEIGVRKVLGASVSSIITLLSKDFLKLVLIAIVIASPIAWYGMHRWLQEFAYKTAIDWWVFAGAGTLAVGIALITVSFQSVKTALMNPVNALRSE